jgi:hypothetical protein
MRGENRVARGLGASRVALDGDDPLVGTVLMALAPRYYGRATAHAAEQEKRYASECREQKRVGLRSATDIPLNGQMVEKKKVDCRIVLEAY